MHDGISVRQLNLSRLGYITSQYRKDQWKLVASDCPQKILYGKSHLKILRSDKEPIMVLQLPPPHLIVGITHTHAKGKETVS